MSYKVTLDKDELHQFVYFLFDRFAAGHEPTEQQIENALGDFQTQINEQRHKAANNDMWPEKNGYYAVSIAELSLDDTTHVRAIEMIKAKPQQPNEIQMRSDQFVKLCGDMPVPANTVLYYRGIPIRFIGKVVKNG